MTMRKKWLPSVLLSLSLALLIACAPRVTPTPSPVPTPAPEPKLSPVVEPSPTVKATPTGAPVSFAGKTITIVVPLSPGGGTDTMCRLWARFLSTYLPGNPSVVIRNIPGGNNIIGTNYAYSSKPDGLALLGGAGGSFLAQLTRMKAVRYDFMKMEAIIGFAGGGVYYIRPSLVEKVENLPKAQGVKFGYSAASLGTIFVVFAKLIDFRPDRVILAYTGGGDARRAFLSGETNLGADSLPGYWEIIDPLVKKGEVQTLFQTGMVDQKQAIVREPGFPPDIPTGKEVYEKIYGKAPSGTGWDAYKALVATQRGYDVVLFASPGTPDSIVRVYWEAGDKILKDPEFRKIADSLVGGKGRWLVGESLSKEFKVNMAITPDAVDWFKGAMLEHGVVYE